MTNASSDHAARRTWLAVLARSERGELEAGLERLAPQLRYEFLRRPECGMVMLRGRAGGSGDAFNLGEASVTRCSVRTADGQVGTGYVLGRDMRKAELVAVFDALLQEDAYRALIEPQLLEPLARAQRQRRSDAAHAAAATQVNFYAMVRGG